MILYKYMANYIGLIVMCNLSSLEITKANINNNRIAIAHIRIQP